MKFEDIEEGQILINKKSGLVYKVDEKMNEHVFSMISLKYLGQKDFVNRSTAEDYEIKRK